MATWQEVRTWVASKGTIGKEGPGWLILEIGTSEVRSQLIEVQYQDATDIAPAMIAFFSSIGRLDAMDDHTLRKAVITSAGGPVTLKAILEGPEGDRHFNLVVAHYTPADTLDELELAWPIQFVSGIADMMEEFLVGGDEH